MIETNKIKNIKKMEQKQKIWKKKNNKIEKKKQNKTKNWETK